MSQEMLQLFSTSVIHKRLLQPRSTLFKELLDECQKVQATDLKGQKWSRTRYPFGYTSYGSLAQLQHFSSTFADLGRELDAQMKECYRKFQFVGSPSQLVLTDLWLNVMQAGSAHSWHIHPHAVLSGTFYLATPKGASGIKFEDPRLDRMMNAPLSKNKQHVELVPAPGDVIFFESWLRHEVPTQMAKQPRVSLSFNYGWKA